MANGDVQEFLARVCADEALRHRCRQALLEDRAAEVIEMGRDMGFNFTRDALFSALTVEADEGELSAEELQAATGGMDPGPRFTSWAGCRCGAVTRL